MNKKRSSGLLLHITSLPSPYGVGDVGPEAIKFADFLAEAGCGWWQVLPLNPTAAFFGYSPYSSRSAFAGNTLLISPDWLAEDGLLDATELRQYHLPVKSKAEFDKAAKLKNKLFDKAYEAFVHQEGFNDAAFKHFIKEHKMWLDDYALFVVLSLKYPDRGWTDWPKEIRDRKPETLQLLRDEYRQQIQREEFLQYQFFRQWGRLKEYCYSKGIRMFGDLPFYLNLDSADTWGMPKYFKLDKRKLPTLVSGVPPDYFSETGQLWGTPVYNWGVLKKDKFSWWEQRVLHNFKLFDLLRLDHFRAFSTAWEVPAGDETAINGQWRKVPGKEFFTLLKERDLLGKIVAEDLGDLSEDVHELIAQFNFPGMKVLQFGFSADENGNPHAPHFHQKHFISYTGTHDNNTTRGWYIEAATKQEKQRIDAYVDKKLRDSTIAPEFCRICFASVAWLAVLPVQDVLNLGAEAIMNRPSTAEGNWLWRLKPSMLTSKHSSSLLHLNRIYDRFSRKDS